MQKLILTWRLFFLWQRGWREFIRKVLFNFSKSWFLENFSRHSRVLFWVIFYRALMSRRWKWVVSSTILSSSFVKLFESKNQKCSLIVVNKFWILKILKNGKHQVLICKILKNLILYTILKTIIKNYILTKLYCFENIYRVFSVRKMQEKREIYGNVRYFFTHVEILNIF